MAVVHRLHGRVLGNHALKHVKVRVMHTEGQRSANGVQCRPEIRLQYAQMGSQGDQLDQLG